MLTDLQYKGLCGALGLTRNVEVVGSSPNKGPFVSLSKKFYPYCLALVGSRNRFECDFTTKLK